MPLVGNVRASITVPAYDSQMLWTISEWLFVFFVDSIVLCSIHGIRWNLKRIDAIYGTTEIGGLSVSLLPKKDHLIWEIETSLTTCMSHQLTWIDCQVQGHLFCFALHSIAPPCTERQHWTLWLVSAPLFQIIIELNIKRETKMTPTTTAKTTNRCENSFHLPMILMWALECVSPKRKFFLFSFLIKKHWKGVAEKPLKTRV